MQVTTKHTGASNHGTGAIAQYRMSVKDITYLGLNFCVFKGTTKATVAQMKLGIESVLIKINGETKVEYTGAELIAQNDYQDKSTTTSDGFFQLNLRKKYKNNWAGQDAYGLGCNDIRNLLIEVKYSKDVVTSDMTTDLYMEHDKGSKLGVYERVIPISGVQSAGDGAKTIRDLTTLSGVMSKIMLTTDKIDEVTIKDGSLVLHESTKELRDNMAKMYGRAPQAGYTVLDFDLIGRISEGILINPNLTLEVNTSELVTFKVMQFVEVTLDTK